MGVIKLIVSILGNTAPFIWKTNKDADTFFKSTVFKVYRKSSKKYGNVADTATQIR